MLRTILIVPFTMLVCGCSTLMIDKAISSHSKVANQINLGDSKADVLAILEPIQQKLRSDRCKPSERHLKDGKEVFIFFARTGRQSDGLTTDDEFTPYVFEDGKLVAIGWTVLGGPKTQGQATSDTYVNVRQIVR